MLFDKLLVKIVTAVVYNIFIISSINFVQVHSILKFKIINIYIMFLVISCIE